VDAVTTYIHGIPEKAVRARSRAIVLIRLVAVIVAIGAAALLVGGGATALVRAVAHGTGGGPWGTRPAGFAPTGPTPAATALDDDLLRRFDAAARAAAADGVTLTITSGWRSAAQQQQLIDQDVATYGVAAAHKLVLPPAESAHVRGEAIDVGPSSGAAWLATHGASFGLCRTYANEAWHFEPVIDPGGSCPAPHADASWAW